MIVVGRIDDRLSREIGIARPQNNSNDPKWNFLPFIGIALIRPHDRRIDEAISNSSGPPSETRIPPNRRGGEGEGRGDNGSVSVRAREGGGGGGGWGAIDEKSRSAVACSYSGRSPRNFVIIHTMPECMPAILKGPRVSAVTKGWIWI